MDYDSDYETKLGPVKDVDPYAGKPFTSRALHLIHSYQGSFSPRNVAKK